MLYLLIFIFYVVPIILILDYLQILYRTYKSNNDIYYSFFEDIYLYQVIVIILLTLCPIINLALSIGVFRLLNSDDEFLEHFKKYSIFKFLFIKLQL